MAAKGKKPIDDDGEDDSPPPPGYVAPAPSWENDSAIAAEVEQMLADLAIREIDPAARPTLRQWLYRVERWKVGDRGSIILTLRSIVESEDIDSASWL